MMGLSKLQKSGTFLKFQNFYTLDVEEYFTKSGYFTWIVSDCEELAGAGHRR